MFILAAEPQAVAATYVFCFAIAAPCSQRGVRVALISFHSGFVYKVPFQVK